MRISIVLAMAAAIVGNLGGCGVPSMSASPERAAEARVLLEDLVAGRDEVLVEKAASQVDHAQLRAQRPFMKTLVPEGPVPEGATAGWRANAGTGGMTYELSQTYQYPDRVLTVNTTFIKQGEVWKVLAFYVAPTMKAAPSPDNKIPVVVESAKAG